ncbi:NHL repeat-containing protein [Pseudomonas fluorescens]|uniref:Delta-60 repeat domain-containing protein n=1 Tax=Pseudomonas fluorescens TaxID=294 RepID=A0A5E6PBE2_PSEFL|nr:hypothetical protein [Pseudomonas fluorescens]VVM40030.1 hypothetical protein PS624_00254 [Pseudomonas fluorescens]
MPEATTRNAQLAGEPDQTFAHSGLQTLQFPGARKTIGNSVAVMPSGRIMVSTTVIDASGASNYGLARLLPDGHLDTGFGQGGYLGGQFANGRLSQGGGLVVDASGAFWLSAVLANAAGKLEQIIARFKPDGTLDRDFGDEQSGYRVVPMRIPTLNNATGGRLILAQSTPAKSMPDRLLFVTSQGGSGLLARFFLDGRNDDDFAENGWIPLTLPSVAITLHGVTQLDGGQILVHGKTEVTNQGLVMAYDSSGQVAKPFGKDGTLLLKLDNAGVPLESSVNRIVVQSAQRLLLIGSAVDSSAGEKRQHGLISGINLTGQADPEFNLGLPVITLAKQPLDLKSWGAGFALNDSPGPRIVTVGQTSEGTRGLLTAGFLADGAVDPLFDVEGAAEIPWIAQDACLQGASVLVLGHRNEAAHLVRLLTAAS